MFDFDPPSIPVCPQPATLPIPPWAIALIIIIVLLILGLLALLLLKILLLILVRLVWPVCMSHWLFACVHCTQLGQRHCIVGQLSYVTICGICLKYDGLPTVGQAYFTMVPHVLPYSHLVDTQLWAHSSYLRLTPSLRKCHILPTMAVVVIANRNTIKYVHNWTTVEQLLGNYKLVSGWWWSWW